MWLHVIEGRKRIVIAVKCIHLTAYIDKSTSASGSGQSCHFLGVCSGTAVCWQPELTLLRGNQEGSHQLNVMCCSVFLPAGGQLTPAAAASTSFPHTTGCQMRTHPMASPASATWTQSLPLQKPPWAWTSTSASLGARPPFRSTHRPCRSALLKR